MPHRAGRHAGGGRASSGATTCCSSASDGLPRVPITDLRTGRTHAHRVPRAGVFRVPGANAEFDTTLFRYGYESLVTPRSVFDYDMDERTARS